jgi:hypothetical protein
MPINPAAKGWPQASENLLTSPWKERIINMKTVGRLAIVAAGFALAVSAAPIWASAATPVLIKQCVVTKPKPLSHNASGTQITYAIWGHKNAASITFAVGYRNAAQNFLRTVTDVGSFAPGVTISHHFALYNDVTYAGAHVTSCIPIRVKWADASLWMAPTH